MSCINYARIVPWHDKWHGEMTNHSTVPVPFPIGGWHWHSDAKDGLRNGACQKMCEANAQIIRRRNGSLDSVERFLDLVTDAVELRERAVERHLEALRAGKRR
jgi:hypothetical protein